jgi:quercetin 2,3-dioxygenase
MNASAILNVERLGFPWQTPDPFLFCVYHKDAYPKGNGRFGPDASLAGRNLGMDFEGKDGWRMYHGETVPGFPRHPHRGFETVTLARHGFIDHSDSLGAIARFGQGDAQWVTAGRGLEHSEMFPLLDAKAPNPVELFQIWLNLPRTHKMATPHFKMLWAPAIPRIVSRDPSGGTTEIVLVAGTLGEARAPAPPPDSWAAQPGSEVAIWTLRLSPGAKWTLPAAVSGINRTLYFFRGAALKADGQDIPTSSAIRLKSDLPVALENGAEESELLMLQGKPIGEPVAQHGPFVMNTRAEILQAMNDYQETRFGGWHWPTDDPVHGAEPVRYARLPDGTEERGQ